MHSSIRSLALALMATSTLASPIYPDKVLYLSKDAGNGTTEQVPATLIKAGDAYNIISQPEGSTEVTTFYTTGEGSKQSLYFFPYPSGGAPAGATAPTEPNSGSTTLNTVYAVSGQNGDGLWNVDNSGHVSHQVRASVAPDSFFLCDETIDGKVQQVLKSWYPPFGVSAPAECHPTSLSYYRRPS